ncbi:MAG: alkaline phosphatase [Phycisphaerales bacterium]|nr:MAG: alkaline phosphatase [Phycisphaerales bacterium]
MFRKSSCLLCLVALLALGMGPVGSAQAQPKYVFFLIGDGMGFEHVKATGMYAYGEAGTLSFEMFPFGGELTNDTASGGIPDSAAAGTALATGVKVDNGVISMAIPGDGSELETLLEYFKARGKSTGLVSTKFVTDATPAAFGAHEPSRQNGPQIAEDYRMQTRPNVLFGGGGSGMSIPAFESAGYTVVIDRDSMQALDTENIDMVCGHFGNGNLPYEPDLGSLPHLSEMAETALQILDNDPDGFFLMIEGAKIDTAGHSNLTGNMVLETLEFSNAVQVAIDWAQGRTDTLIIVTADHETGGLVVLENNGAGLLPTVEWTSGTHTESNVPVYAWGANAELISGVMDNTEMFSVATAGPQAWNPNPVDGAVLAKTQGQFSWTPGMGAVTHNIYFGESFEDVNDGTVQTFRGNQTDAVFSVGSPGGAYPDRLAPGMTYYWRIDEVEADGTTTHRGPVWSIVVPPSTAHHPDPADGARFVRTDVSLGWTAGTDARLHHVYFGDNVDDVNARAASTYVGANRPTTAYLSDPLELEKVYYWCVDEFDGWEMHKGDIWRFTTTRAGGGWRADYYHWTGNAHGFAPMPSASAFRTPVLSRTDAQINFGWGMSSPDPSINADNFSVIWAGEIEVAFSEPHTFYVKTDGGVKLWVNDELIIDDWRTHELAEKASEPIELVSGQRYPIVMWWFESVGSARAELHWQSPHTSKQLIPQAALWPPVRAGSPSPADGARDVAPAPVLSWAAGDNAVQHDLYFGTDPAAVTDADTGTAGIYRGRQAPTTYVPPGDSEFGRSYYWRIDEVNADGTVGKGRLWSFAVADYLLVDDFEDYITETNRIVETWKGGADGSGNGAVIGYPDSDATVGEHSLETRIVHGDGHSMPYFYDNSVGYSEAAMTLVWPRDWTQYGVGALSLWFRGYPSVMGSFTEEPNGIYKMTAAGADIWNLSDEFHFAYKEFSGSGGIAVRVDSVEHTNDWAKAGVMIRSTLEANSANAMMYVTPDGRAGVQVRFMDGDVTYGGSTDPGAFMGPMWLRLGRAGDDIIFEISSDGVDWMNFLGEDGTVAVPMGQEAHIGLVVTSHEPGVACTAEFSNLEITASVEPLWADQDIGIVSNVAEPMYVSLANAAGPPAVVYHDDPNAAIIDTWTEWTIPLKLFADRGIDLTDVDAIALGFGDKSNPQPGDSGQMYFDDMRLYRLETAP